MDRESMTNGVLEAPLLVELVPRQLVQRQPTTSIFRMLKTINNVTQCDEKPYYNAEGEDERPHDVRHHEELVRVGEEGEGFRGVAVRRRGGV